MRARSLDSFTTTTNGTFKDVEYALNGDYAVFIVDELSELFFVGEQPANTSRIIPLIIAIAILALGAGVVIYIESKNGKDKEVKIDR